MSERTIKGVTQETIAEWKSKFGEIFLISFGDEQFVYRPLKRFEYKTIMNNPESTRAFNEEKIFQMCIIHPTIDATKLPSLKAGTIATVVELIMTASNFGVTEEPIRL